MADVPTAPQPLSPAQKAMRKLGLVRDIDLALHIPLRYLDETVLRPIGTLRDLDTAQVQGTVRECRIDLGKVIEFHDELLGKGQMDTHAARPVRD